MSSQNSNLNTSPPLAHLRYFLLLALRSFRRDRFLISSVLLTLGVGIAASMTVFSILHVLAGDPIPQKSARLFQPTISGDNIGISNPPHLYSLPDAQEMFQQLQPPEQGAMMAQGFSPSISAGDGHQYPGGMVRFTTAPFFRLFDVPFLHGGPWSAEADGTGEHVAVLGTRAARALFGAMPALNKMVRLGGLSLRVVGILDQWKPVPRFYDLTPGAYTAADDVYVPVRAIQDMTSQVFVSYGCAAAADGTDIQKGHFAALLGPRCSWLTLWVEITSPEGHRRMEALVARKLAQLKKEHRALPAASSSLPDVMQTLANAHVVPGDIRAYTVMGFLFLWLCVLSATGTLLGKFLRRSSEIGVRRALGASRQDILFQFLVESGLLGVASGILGIALAELSLWVIRHSPSYLAGVVDMSGILLAASVSLAVVSGVLAGLLPSWRAARTDIGIIVKVS